METRSKIRSHSGDSTGADKNTSSDKVDNVKEESIVDKEADIEHHSDENDTEVYENENDNEIDSENENESASISNTLKRKKIGTYTHYSICGCKQVGNDLHTMCWRCRLLVNLPICSTDQRCYECVDMTKSAFRYYRASMTNARTAKRKKIAKLRLNAQSVINHYKQCNPAYTPPNTLLDLFLKDSSNDLFMVDLLVNCEMLPIGEGLTPLENKEVDLAIQRVVGELSFDPQRNSTEIDIKSEGTSQTEFSDFDIPPPKPKGKGKGKTSKRPRLLSTATSVQSPTGEQSSQVANINPIVGISRFENYFVGFPSLTVDSFIFGECVEIVKEVSEDLVEDLSCNLYRAPKLMVESKEEAQNFITIKLDPSLLEMLNQRSREGKESETQFLLGHTPLTTNVLFVPWEPYWSESRVLRVRPMDWPTNYLGVINQEFTGSSAVTTTSLTVCYLEEVLRKQLRVLNMLNIVLATALPQDYTDPCARAKLIKSLPRLVKDGLKLNLEGLYQIVQIRRKSVLSNAPTLSNQQKRELQHQSLLNGQTLFE